MEGYRLKRGGVLDWLSFNPMTMRDIHNYFMLKATIHEYHICRARRKLLKIS